MTPGPRCFRPPDGHFFLFGPRGTGKTTWLREQHGSAVWLDLLDPALERELVARPELLRAMVEAAKSAGVVVIDEVQRAPGLLTVVHQLIEEKVPGRRFILTGSSARKLRRSGVDLLGGRAAVARMHPFLGKELGKSFDLDRALELGLVPGVLGAVDPIAAARAYLSLYIREEVRAEGLVRNLDAFARFLEAISFSHAASLNLANVAREAQISRATVEGFVGIVEDLLLGWRMPAFQKRARRQLASHPKFFWFDAGVFRSIRPKGPLDRPEEIAGPALEGLVAQHLRAWIDYSAIDASLSFWRTKGGLEVDFVVYGADTFCAIEVKHASRIHDKDLRSLLEFGKDYPEAQLRMLYRGSRRLEIAGVRCVPVGEFLSALQPSEPLPD